MAVTTRPRVLLLTQVLPYPPDSGPKVKTWNVIKCLAADYDVTVASFVRGDQTAHIRHLERYCTAVHVVPLRRGRAGDAWHLARSLVRREPFLMVRDDRAAMQRLVERLAAAGGFDVVHADQLNMAQYALRVPGARKVLDTHNALWQLYERLWQVMPRGARRLILKRDWQLLRGYEGRACRAFDAVLTVTEADRKALREIAPSLAPISIVPIAVDTEEVQPAPRHPAANHLVHIGTMYWPPNVDAVRWFVRQVYPRIRAACPDVAFDVIGARPTRGVRALAQGPARIRVTGYVDDPRPYLERAAAVVVPLRVGSGMRVKILTALAQGLPVVTTSVGCAGLAVESGRHLLIADSPEDFAAATMRLLGDGQLGAQLGRNGRQLVETRYDIRVVGPQLRDVYRRIVAADGAYRLVG